MTFINSITRMSDSELREYEWPSRGNVDDYSGVGNLACRDVKLYSGRIIGRDEVDRKWKDVSSKLLEIL